MNDLHNHKGIPIGSGELMFNDEKVKIIEGRIYLDNNSQEEEQRICLTLNKSLQIKGLKKENAFVTLHLKKGIKIRTFPIKTIKVFLLSASFHDFNIDCLISPKIEKLNKFIRPKY